ncbi:hypothetical protein RFI_25944, partial [Reticulomyxa filosa]
ELLDLFRPLCRPEEIVKMQIEEDIRFLSLGTIVVTQRKNSKDQMAMVITNDMEHNIPTEWMHCTKKISSFKKVNQFEKTVKEFFKDEPSEDVLILQCRYMPDSKDQLEQIIHILQLEHHIFYSEPTNSKKQKLIILLIHTNKTSPFPLIFRQLQKTILFVKTKMESLFFKKNRKWKIVYVDYLLSTDTISLKKDLRKPVASVISGQLRQNLSKCARGAFGRLYFPHSMDSLKEKKLLSLLFEDNKFRECGAILTNRMKKLLSKAAYKRSVENILSDLEKSGKKRMEGSFFEGHQNVVDTLLTLTFVNVLFIIYQNGGFAVLFIFLNFITISIKYIESVNRKDEIEYQWYKKLFEEALQNEVLFRMKPVNIDTSHLLLAVINPQLYSIQNYLQYSFPFSYSIHSWCQRRLSKYSKSQTMIQVHMQQCWNKCQLEITKYSLEAIHEYAMDMVRFEFSLHLHTPNQQIILRNVIVSMALLLCGKLTIATIEVTIHYYRYIIFHYSYLISVSELAHVEEHVIENQPGQWLAKMTLSLWESILFRESRAMSEGLLFFLTSISILFNFLLKHLQNSNTNLMNKLLANARKIEIHRLGVIYLQTSEFINEEKHLIEHGFLENETSIDHILQGYSTQPNVSQQKYSDFIQDLLITIKRVERIEKNANKRNVYISILPKLYSKIGNKLIPKMQILKEMVSHGYLNNELALYSDEATRLNRCLEIMLLKKEVNEENKDWKELCDKDDTSDLGCVVKISKVKVDVTKLISAMIDGDIDLTQVEGNECVFNSLEEMSKLLLDFSSCYKQYEHALYVWFLKQLYVRKGFHWIEIIFTPSNTGTKFPFLGKLKRSHVFSLLRPRTLHNNSFNPFIGLYGENACVNNIQHNTDNYSSIPLNSFSRRICDQMILQSFLLLIYVNPIRIVNTKTYKAQRLNCIVIDLLLSSDVQNEHKKVLQTITNWIFIKGSLTLSMRDTLDVIVTRLGFHFVSILPFMKQNPFQLLLVNSESFLPISTECETVSNESLKVHYCSNNHALLIDGSEDILKQ